MITADYDMKKYDQIVVSAEDFLKVREQQKGNIKDVRIISAKLTGKDFGKICVTLKTPEYKADL